MISVAASPEASRRPRLQSSHPSINNLLLYSAVPWRPGPGGNFGGCLTGRHPKTSNGRCESPPGAIQAASREHIPDQETSLRNPAAPAPARRRRRAHRPGRLRGGGLRQQQDRLHAGGGGPSRPAGGHRRRPGPRQPPPGAGDRAGPGHNPHGLGRAGAGRLGGRPARDGTGSGSTPRPGSRTRRPGRRSPTIQRAAEARGWFYPPDPSSKEYCTIGGNIACNAGGMHGGKYGVTRDFVLALEGFLPTGEYVEWGTRDEEVLRGLQHARPVDRQRGHARGDHRGHAEADPAACRRAGRCWRRSRTRSRPSARSAPSSPRACSRPSANSSTGIRSIAPSARPGSTLFGGPGRAARSLLLIELAGKAGEVREDKPVVLAWARSTPRPSARPAAAPRPRSSGRCAASAPGPCSSSATPS